MQYIIRVLLPNGEKTVIQGNEDQALSSVREQIWLKKQYAFLGPKDGCIFRLANGDVCFSDNAELAYVAELAPVFNEAEPKSLILCLSLRRGEDKIDLADENQHKPIQYQPISKQGYLTKQGNGRVGEVIWRKRYIVLQDYILFGYDKEEKCTNGFPANFCLDLRTCDISSANTKRRNSFCLTSGGSDGESIYFCAYSPQDMEEWIDCFRSIAIRWVKSILVTSSQALKRVGGLTEEGIFRLSGNKKYVDALMLKFNAGDFPFVDTYTDRVHVLSSVYKHVLRKMVTPLLTFEHYADFVDLGQEDLPEEERNDDLVRVIAQIPFRNQTLLKYIMSFFGEVIANIDKNLMSSHNLSICMAPNLLRPPVGQLRKAFEDNDQILLVFEKMIDNCEEIFQSLEMIYWSSLSDELHQTFIIEENNIADEMKGSPEPGSMFDEGISDPVCDKPVKVRKRRPKWMKKARNCGFCKKPCSIPYLRSDQGMYYHNECLKCDYCLKKLKPPEPFIARGDKKLHALCAAEVDSACYSCRKHVTGKYIEACDKIYHAKCFRCYGCQRSLKNGYIIKQRQVHCDKCIQKDGDVDIVPVSKDFRCDRCGKQLLYIFVDAQEKKYHQDCFVCKYCARPLNKGYIPSDDGLLCIKCGFTNTKTEGSQIHFPETRPPPTITRIKSDDVYLHLELTKVDHTDPHPSKKPDADSGDASPEMRRNRKKKKARRKSEKPRRGRRSSKSRERRLTASVQPPRKAPRDKYRSTSVAIPETSVSASSTNRIRTKSSMIPEEYKKIKRRHKRKSSSSRSKEPSRKSTDIFEGVVIKDPPKQLNFCPKCGTKQSPNNEFCDGCGKDLRLMESVMDFLVDLES